MIQLFFDLFGCNLLGILLGLWFLNYFAVGKLHWVYRKEEDEERKRRDCSILATTLSKFKPSVWRRHEWHIFDSLKNYGVFIFICTMVRVV